MEVLVTVPDNEFVGRPVEYLTVRDDGGPEARVGRRQKQLDGGLWRDVLAWPLTRESPPDGRAAPLHRTVCSIFGGNERSAATGCFSRRPR